LRNDFTQAATDHRAGDGAGDGADLEALLFGRVGGAVTKQHVCELVRHHARHFAFTLRRFDHAAIDEHRAAGERKRVDVLQVYRRKRIFERVVIQLGRGSVDQALAEPLEVTANL
jgi:hypothetical protein